MKIDQSKCVGCGACTRACHEGAIKLVNGKATLISDNYCDGLGNCLPACPVNAITIEEREAPAFDRAAAQANKESNKPLACGCAGTHSEKIQRNESKASANYVTPESQLAQWPVQIKLVPINAPYFDGVNLLVAADCTAYAFADFHNKFIKNHTTIIGCPKLDATDYSEKLGEIIANNSIKTISVVRMEVPCCGGIEAAVKEALQRSGKSIPLHVHIVTRDGRV